MLPISNVWRSLAVAAFGAAMTVAGAGATVAAEAAKDGAAAKEAKKLYLTKTCVACHGKDGKKAILMYPNLAGQEALYAFEQMRDIAAGKRLSGPDDRGYPRTQAMKDVMHLVAPDEMKKIAGWLSSLEPAAPVAPAEPIAEERLKQGATLYTKLTCHTCHGKEGKKPLKGYPYLASQKRDYLVLQMKELRDGVRSNGKSKMMLPTIKKANDEQIELLADYLSQLPR